MSSLTSWKKAITNLLAFGIQTAELRNNLLSNSFLICYDNSNILPEGGYATDYSFNVKCNCFDNSTPSPQLYPVGS